MVYSARGVRPDEITDRNIRLAGVHEGFIDALEEDRASDLDYHERDRYDDERDDYDDEQGGAPRRGRSYDDTDYRPRRRRRDPDAPDDRPRGRGRDDDRRGYDDDRDDRPRRRRDEYDD
jgi:polyribonucleotide nucleotidyltransferase